MQQFIGAEVQFVAQPYYQGRGKIEALRPCHSGKEGQFQVDIRTTEATQRNRLLGSISHDPFNDEIVTLYGIGEGYLDRALAGETLRYVYPV